MLGSKLWGPPPLDVAQGYQDFREKYGPTFFTALGASVEKARQSGSLTWLSASALAARVIDMLSKRQPGSLIRLSDGEGNLVAWANGFGADTALLEWCLQRISYIHFGDFSVIDKDRAFFADLVVTALNSADVIGFAEIASIVATFARAEEEVDVRAHVGNQFSLLHLNERLQQQRSVTGANVWFNRDLLPHYRNILKAAPQIVVITSYEELPGRLGRAMGIPMERISCIPLPQQAVFTATAQRKDTQHFPNRMREVIREIRAQEDYALFLVAGGLLGKHYCAEAKAVGGLAIDIGSVPEMWLGVPARGLPDAMVRQWVL